MNTLTINDEHKAREIDFNEKNKFKFAWLNNTVKVNVKNEEFQVTVGDSISKVDVSGKAKCSLCYDIIYYGKRGFSAISSHIKSGKHVLKEDIKRKNFVLPSHFSTSSSVNASSSVNIPVNVPLCDRIVNAQSLVLGVLAEHNLPFTMSPVLINLSKTLANDKRALNNLQMSRATASYKMRLGLAKTFLEETIENLRISKFSLNVDEATANNFKRVLSILVSYFSSVCNRVVVEHLTSINVTTVSSEALFKVVVKIFQDNDIPWDNLVSILMDSCNVMRGSKSGLETRIRDKASHLLDIDGDSCHHIHNSAKKFCESFEGHVEKYFTDLHNDFKWSSDQKELFSEICDILSIKYTAIDNMIPYRWLSCYDVALSNLRIINALTIFYYAFLSSTDKPVYFSILAAIYQEKEVSVQGRAKIRDIHKVLMQKKFTAEGFARKKRILQKLFFERKKTRLVLNFYVAVLPLLKKYACLFQSKEPLIHKLHDEQEQLFINFLSCFLKQENLKDKSVKQLLSLDISLEENMLKKTKMFLGSAEPIVMNNLKDSVVVNFLKNVQQAYVQCAQYMQKKLPLDNTLLKCASAIDPVARGHSITAERLKILPKLVKNILTEEELSQYALDVHLFQVDKCLPSHLDEQGNAVRIDVWWAMVFSSNKYTALSKVVKALLSCFHGPQVESSFSIMGNVLDKGSSNLKIESFSAIQTVKYKLLTQNKSAIEFFKKKDHLHDSVNKRLCYNMQSSYQTYKKELECKEKEAQVKKDKLKLNKKVPSKLEDNMLMKKRENNLRRLHKRRLEKLVEERKIKKKKI